MTIRPEDEQSTRTRRPPEVLTDAEVRALPAACGDFGSVAARHKAMLALLDRAGLRISEALSLRPHDPDFEAGAVRVRFGKGGYDRSPGSTPAPRRWSGKDASLVVRIRSLVAVEVRTAAPCRRGLHPSGGAIHREPFYAARA